MQINQLDCICIKSISNYQACGYAEQTYNHTALRVLAYIAASHFEPMKDGIAQALCPHELSSQHGYTEQERYHTAGAWHPPDQE